MFVDLVHPITSTFREQLNQAVLATYALHVKEMDLASV
jgi:DNA-binding cell septation regulator SpoVG